MKEIIRKKIKYFTGASLLFALSMFSACGTSATSNADSSNKNSSNASAANNSSAVNPTETAKEERDTSPLTLSLGELVSEGGHYNIDVEKLKKKYEKRIVTFSDVFLSQINSSDITADDSRTSNGNYVLCKGNFTDYMDSKSKVEQLSGQSKPLTATVRGTLTNIEKMSYDQIKITLESCELVNVEKES